MKLIAVFIRRGDLARWLRRGRRAPAHEVTFPADSFRRVDDSPDVFFYRQPRFVEHIDDAGD